MIILLYKRNWDLVTDGSCVFSKANKDGYKDSYFGSFGYFERYVRHYDLYDKLTDVGKGVYDIAKREVWISDLKDKVKKYIAEVENKQ